MDEVDVSDVDGLPQPGGYRSALPWRAGVVDVIDRAGHPVAIAYEEVGTGEPVVLVMGLSIQSIFWPDEFCAGLVERGFRVIRFDNRDIGLSGSADRGAPVRITRDFLLSRVAPQRLRANYTLHDMVGDTVGLLDHLGLASAHVVGLSLGGIIAQMIAATTPARIKSLGLIMSHTNHPLWGVPHPRVLLSMGPPPPGSTRDHVIARNVANFQQIGSPKYRRSDDELRFAFTVAADRERRGDDTSGLDRQTHALFATGCIDHLLPSITAPTTVLHGLADTLVVPRNARRVARRIKGSTLHLFDGMGHDFPPALLPRWAELIADNIARAR